MKVSLDKKQVLVCSGKAARTFVEKKIRSRNSTKTMVGNGIP